jgi:hypothetical protein
LPLEAADGTGTGLGAEEDEEDVDDMDDVAVMACIAGVVVVIAGEKNDLGGGWAGEACADGWRDELSLLLQWPWWWWLW